MTAHPTIGPTPERRRKKKRQSITMPGYDGVRELGVREVDDPYEPGAKISVPWNVRHDPLARMLARKDIDDAQYRAGHQLRLCVEFLGGSGAPAVDTTREAVDGGKGYGGPSERSWDAAKKLRDAQHLLGWQTYRLVRGIVCDGLNGSLIAQQSGAGVDRKNVTSEVRRGLENLAILWGYLSDPKHLRAKADMVSAIGERADWLHEETSLIIQYSSAKDR